jgi:hypothetical protein
MRSRLFLVLLSLASCVATPIGIGGVAYPGVNAALSSVVALGVAAEQGPATDCKMSCGPGTACNPRTDTCGAIPCGGTCREDQQCQESNIVPYCMLSVWDGEASH